MELIIHDQAKLEATRKAFWLAWERGGHRKTYLASLMAQGIPLEEAREKAYENFPKYLPSDRADQSRRV